MDSHTIGVAVAVVGAVAVAVVVVEVVTVGFVVVAAVVVVVVVVVAVVVEVEVQNNTTHIEADMKRVEFETFLPPSSWTISQLKDDAPSTVNEVRVRKYRVVWEEVEEPVEVIRERIQKLWNECTNHHRWAKLRAAAKEVGLELSYETRRKK